jgi:hypothetical protein
VPRPVLDIAELAAGGGGAVTVVIAEAPPTATTDHARAATPPPRREPYLSIVATARNDNHGGELLRRMQAFVSMLAAQCDRHGLDAELLLVEWNPPEDRRTLREVLQWPDSDGRCGVRLITVPGDVHARFAHADRLPLFQMIAKNVGVRRARAPFVLATNIDVILSDGLMRLLAGRSLRADRMYRADRVDVAADIPDPGDAPRLLAWCEANVIRINGRDATLDTRTGERHRVHWDWTWRVRLLEALQDLRVIPAVTRKRLHLNACGDFTLMHRDRWAAVRGYPELPQYSMHLDSVLCTAAHFGGAREQHLPHPVYHVEHATGSGWSPEGQVQLDARLARAGVPQMTLMELQRLAVRMRHERRPAVFNGEAWGLAGDVLEEWMP